MNNWELVHSVRFMDDELSLIQTLQKQKMDEKDRTLERIYEKLESAIEEFRLNGCPKRATWGSAPEALRPPSPGVKKHDSYQKTLKRMFFKKAFCDGCKDCLEPVTCACAGLSCTMCFCEKHKDRLAHPCKSYWCAEEGEEAEIDVGVFCSENCGVDIDQDGVSHFNCTECESLGD